MQRWPASHHFEVHEYYTIDLEHISFLDFYGGPAKLTVAEYLAAHIQPDESTVYA
eukprot:Skav201704  [mRNA]  locus=scaffold641:1030177:1035161:- [translate_table: standard]